MLLFKETEEQLDWEYTILVSFMEIYNEMLRDLLSTEPTTKLDIKQSKDGIHVPNMTHVKVTCVGEVNEVCLFVCLFIVLLFCLFVCLFVQNPYMSMLQEK